MGASHSTRATAVSRTTAAEEEAKNDWAKGRSLLAASWRGDAGEVRQLIKNGVDVDFSDNGTIALISAANRGHADIVRLLIDAGANVKAADTIGYTALHWAKSEEIMQQLLRAGADINQGSCNGDTPLHCAIAPGRFHFVPFLLRSNAKAYLRNKGGLLAREIPLSIRPPHNYDLPPDIVEMLKHYEKQHGKTVKAARR